MIVRPLLFLLVPAVLCGQADTTSARPRPLRSLGSRFLRPDSAELSVGARSVWRASDLGAVPLAAGIHIGVWQIDGIEDRHALVAGISASVPVLDRSAPASADFRDVNGGYRFKFDTEQGELNLLLHQRRFTHAGSRIERNALEASVQRRFGLPCLELRPIAGLLVSREVGARNSVWIEPSLELGAGLPNGSNNARSIGITIELRPAFGDVPQLGRTAGDFRFQGGTTGARLIVDWSKTDVGPLAFEVGGDLWWTRTPYAVARGVLTARFVVK